MRISTCMVICSCKSHRGLRRVLLWLLLTLSIVTATVKTKELPDSILVGYATDCDPVGVQRAVLQGVNVVIWSFIGIHNDAPDTFDMQSNSHASSTEYWKCVHETIQQLDDLGYHDNTIHLTSVGGWNGRHLDTEAMSASTWYNRWKNQVGSFVDGIDWDLEGNDQLDHPDNEFSLSCLHMMGEISQLAKEDGGYIISLAPPQSYLDITSSNFSRFVNLTDPTRSWHKDFSYFGANVYAYILSKYGDYIDFVSIQFYESYSKASMAVNHDNFSPEEYLIDFVTRHARFGELFFVEFDQDHSLEYARRFVHLPLSKLVLGFANGWAGGEKALFVESTQIGMAYKTLLKNGSVPRGFMFWVIGKEGTNGVYYAHELNEILNIRNVTGQLFNDSPSLPVQG